MTKSPEDAAADAAADAAPAGPGQTLRTAAGSCGLALMAGGFWMAWPPLALIVPGALLLALAVAGTLRITGKARG